IAALSSAGRLPIADVCDEAIVGPSRTKKNNPARRDGPSAVLLRVIDRVLPRSKRGYLRSQPIVVTADRTQRPERAVRVLFGLQGSPRESMSACPKDPSDSQPFRLATVRSRKRTHAHTRRTCRPSSLCRHFG